MKILKIMIVTIFFLSFLGVEAVSAQGSGAIWTTRGDCGAESQDVNHFEKGEVVYINGDNFAPGSYDWYIEGKPGNASDDPNIQVASGSYTVGETGAFCFAAYTIPNDDGGEYSVKFGNKNDNYRVDRDAASVLINVGTCVWNETEEESSTVVSITIVGAELTINGMPVTYTSSTTISLPPGTYTYSWEALPGYTGSGSGSFTVIDCEPESASASVNVGACVWNETDGSLTPVTITLFNASLTINGVTYIESTTINLPPGTYPYTWVAADGFQGSGSGSITVYDCSPDSAYASVEVGACVWDEEDGSLTPVTITITNASLTIDGDTYEESTTIYLPPGTYDYYWEADPNYQGEGSGQVTVQSCEPEEEEEEKEEKKEDEEPDVPAGGMGPSIISTLAIPMTGVSGLGIAWYILKKFFKKLG